MKYLAFVCLISNWSHVGMKNSVWQQLHKWPWDGIEALMVLQAKW